MRSDYYDDALAALESKATDCQDDSLIEMQDERDRLARILAALIRQLRPDLILLYADDAVFTTTATSVGSMSPDRPFLSEPSFFWF
ncbi:MAG: hypothetical protein F6K42_02455 [Leptolyngbya sp. SIO1D8]|nr:hypothetical protein [Leptolyngbya sp. SIO1D8]